MSTGLWIHAAYCSDWKQDSSQCMLLCHCLNFPLLYTALLHFYLTVYFALSPLMLLAGANLWIFAKFVADTACMLPKND